MSKSMWYAVLIACTLAACVPASAAPRYEIVDIGTLGGLESRAYGINNKGQVVGYSTTEDGAKHAFVWDRTNGMQDLGAFGYMEGSATDINDDGAIVGHGSTDYMHHAAILDRVGEQYRSLDLRPGDSVSAVYSINASGQSAGFSGTSYDVKHAVIWDSDGHLLQDLGPGAALCINADGSVGGFLLERRPDSMYMHEQAFYWSEETGLLRMGWGRVTSINDHGQVMGYSTAVDCETFTWDAQNGMQPFDSTGYGSSVDDMNNLGQVAGTYRVDPDRLSRAMRWDPDNGLIDLGILPGYTRSQAFAINESGMLVGSSWNSNFVWRATAWIPVVPEPSGLVVLSGALLGMAAAIRRRRA